MTQPALRGDYLFFGALQALYKLDKTTAANAQVIAELPSVIDQDAAPLIDDYGNIFFGTGGTLSAYRSDGFRYWSTKVITRPVFVGYPALSPDGTLYLATFINFQVPQETNYLFSIRLE
jgi:outer membrane protein assembly factor BamB